MIAKAGTGSSFGGLFKYLMHGRTRGLQDYLLGDPERVAWTATRNIPLDDPQLAARVMEATAHQNERVQKPVYHLSLSAAPGEDFTREQWERIAERVLRDIGLDEHQALLVAHRDTDHAHLHLMVNRVHPERLKAWDNSYDYPRIERSLRHLEREWNLREVPGRHYQLQGQERPQRNNGLTAGERREKERTQQEVWAERVRFKIRRDVQRAQGWADLEHRLKKHGLRLKKRGRGLVVTDGERMVKASRVHRGSSYAKLAERFGATFNQWQQDRGNLLEAVDRLEQQERLRSALLRRQMHYSGKVKGSVRTLKRLDRLRADLKQAHHLVPDAVAHAYRPADVPAAQRRLKDILERHGWEKVARVLDQEPERLGRLRGYALARWGTDARVRADRELRYAARTARAGGKLHRLIQREESNVPRLRQQIEHANAQLKWIRRRLRRLSMNLTLQRQIERLALRIGLKAVDLTLPRPAAIAVRAVVTTLDRARHDTGRVLER